MREETIRTLELLTRAMRELRPVQARFHGRPRTFSPLAIGDGLTRVFAWQFGGETSEGQHLPDWRCFAVENLEGAALTAEAWRPGGPTKGYRQHCLTTVELAVPPSQTTADLSPGAPEPPRRSR